MRIEKPTLNGRTDRENLMKLATWAEQLCDALNYEIEENKRQHEQLGGAENGEHVQ